MVSYHSHLDILVIMAAPTRRLGVGVLPQGRLVMTWGAWLSLTDCTIFAKLGSHVGFFPTGLTGGVDTCSKIVCLPEIVEVEVVATVAVKGMTRGFECPGIGVICKEPLGKDLCLQFQPCALVASWTSSSPSLELLKDVIFFQDKGGSFIRIPCW